MHENINAFAETIAFALCFVEGVEEFANHVVQDGEVVGQRRRDRVAEWTKVSRTGVGTLEVVDVLLQSLNVFERQLRRRSNSPSSRPDRRRLHVSLRIGAVAKKTLKRNLAKDQGQFIFKRLDTSTLVRRQSDKLRSRRCLFGTAHGHPFGHVSD
jgi:hypothetical protein